VQLLLYVESVFSKVINTGNIHFDHRFAYKHFRSTVNRILHGWLLLNVLSNRTFDFYPQNIKHCYLDYRQHLGYIIDSYKIKKQTHSVALTLSYGFKALSFVLQATFITTNVQNEYPCWEVMIVLGKVKFQKNVQSLHMVIN